jgi:hypothetical protein
MASAIGGKDGPVSPMEAQLLMAQAKHLGMPDEVLSSAPRDPEAFKQWATTLADPKVLTEIWKIKTETPANVREKNAQAGKYEMDTQLAPREVAAREMSARASQTSAGAAASNAQTNRMQYTNPNMQHVGDGQGGVYGFDPRTGNVKQSTTGSPKLTEKQRNEIAELNAEAATVEQAIQKAKGTPDAFGVGRGLASEAGPLVESFATRMSSPDENMARAAVFNTVSSVIKQRAGTAQSKQEQTNIMRFMPSPYEGVDQIEAKFRAYQEYMTTRAQAYGQPVGARPSSTSSSDGWGKAQVVK